MSYGSGIDLDIACSGPYRRSKTAMLSVEKSHCRVGWIHPLTDRPAAAGGPPNTLHTHGSQAPLRA